MKEMGALKRGNLVMLTLGLLTSFVEDFKNTPHNLPKLIQLAWRWVDF